MGTRRGGYLTPARILAAGVFVAVLVAMALVPGLVGNRGHADRVAGGIFVLGRDFSNLPQEQVGSQLQAAFDTYAHASFLITAGEVRVGLTVADLGASLDVPATRERILDAASQEGLGDWLARLAGRPPQKTLLPVVAFDETQFQSALDGLPATFNRSPKNARLRIDGAEAVLTPAEAGRQVDLDWTGRRLRAHVMAAETDDVQAVVDQLPPALADADWHAAFDTARRVISEAVEVRYKERTWKLSREELGRMLVLDPPKARQEAQVRWNELSLSGFLENIAGVVDVPAQDARVERQKDRYAVVGGTAGLKVDLAENTSRIKAAALGTNRQVDLAVVTAPPAVAANDWLAATDTANRAIASDMSLTYAGRTWPLTVSALTSMITFTTTNNSAARYTVQLDGEKLGVFVRKVAKELDKPVREPRLKLVDGKVGVLAEAQDGIAVDVAATTASISKQVFTDQRNVPISVAIVKPKLAAPDLSKISFPDQIMEASTSYAGSISERAHNVELAAERLNGTIVPPGGIFSFNESVGPTTLAAGYQIGYGITLKNDQVVTVPSEAGGICQVATTIFQAAFWSGMPIVERQSHLYWIPRYSSRDLAGLDATVDDPYLDFKFRNASAGWLLVEASTDGASLRFALRGQKPSWEVKVDPPSITGIVKASQVSVRQEDPTMAKGKELWVEHAEDGFTSRIRRVVLEGGKPVDTLDVVSNYRPSQNVLLAGTAEPTPTATPMPEATAIISPTVAPSPAGTRTPVTTTPITVASAIPTATAARPLPTATVTGSP